MMKGLAMLVDTLFDMIERTGEISHQRISNLDNHPIDKFEGPKKLNSHPSHRLYPDRLS